MSIGERERRRVRLCCNKSAVDMAPQTRNESRRDYAGAGIAEGTVMRHFLRASLAPHALARGMSTRAAVALLVALRSAVQ
ncbi:MAG: hypothetical protein ACREU6_02215 [Steroidobacteraceae bacterium]